MATPLHADEALESLANGPAGIARDWATSRLALQAPDRFRVFPAGDDVWDVVLAAGPPRLIPALAGALREDGDVSLGLAASVAGMAAFGVLPEDPAALAGAIRDSMGNPGASDLWLAFALAQLGEADGKALAAAAAVRDADADWLLPIVVLHVAGKTGAADDAAREIARGIAPKLSADPALLGAILGGLGVPMALGSEEAYPELREPEGAVDFGAYLANGSVPEMPAIKGSRRRRVSAWMAALLDGRDHPAAALLRALYADDANLDWGMWPLTTAAWLAAYDPQDPIEDVFNRNAGGDGTRLSEARRLASSVEPAAIADNLQTHGNTSTAVVAMPLLANGEAPELADAVIQHLVDGARNGRAVALATAAAWSRADRVPELISNRATRDLGLLLAEWVPTEEVLVALLELEVPADPDARLLYARSLALMGDQAAMPHLATLLEHDADGSLAEAGVLAQGILG